MYDNDAEEFFAHYGVKGMKWGVRKDHRRDLAVRRLKSERASFQALRDGDNLNRRGKTINVVNRATMGKKLTNKYYDAHIRRIDNEIGLVTSGKPSVSRFLATNGGVKTRMIKTYKGDKKREPLKISSRDSAATKRAKEDYNTLSDRDFFLKSATTKDVYARRVERYGDPYKHSPLAKAGKALEKSSFGKNAKRRAGA